MINEEKLTEGVKILLEEDQSGHDYYHAERVMRLAKIIQKNEGGDLDVILTAGLVHDIYRPWEKKTGKPHFGDEALKMMEEFLKPYIADELTLRSVLEVVKDHDIHDWSERKEKSVELKVVQDADYLDAIGAIGIARVFAFGGANGIDMYIPGENLVFEEDFVDDPNNRKSSVAHFYEKLLKLKENMNTNTGKIIAEDRTVLMENFLKSFFDEWEVKDIL